MKTAPTPPGFDHSSLSMLVAAARRSIKHAVSPLLEPLDLTPHQAWMILLLRETGPLSLTDLASRMWLDHPTASRLVHSLEERRLLAINQDPDHGRRIRIGICEEGAAFVETLFMASETFRERMECGLSGEDKDAFRRMLGQMLHNIADMGADLPKPKGGARSRTLEPD